MARFEVAHMYGVHDSILLLSFGSTLQRTVWHSFAMAISGNHEAGVADRFRLA